MMKFLIVLAIMCEISLCEQPVNGIRASNVLGGAEQHASFSFVRPGLTQTAYAFNGPSSHQSFSSSIGNPHLAQRVLPSIAQSLAHRNPGLGYFPAAPIPTSYASSPYIHGPGVQFNSVQPQSAPSAFSYQQQTPLDQATALAYLQQYQQYQQQAHNAQLHQAYLQQAQVQQSQNSDINAYYLQSQLGQLLALRQQQQGQLQFQTEAQHQQAQGQNPISHQRAPIHETLEQVPKQVLQLQQQVQQSSQPQQGQNLLGVAYSSAPSVAHVKVSGNGYKFDF